MRQEEIWISEQMNKRRKRKIWQELVKVMSCVVVFCTVYALILPAITQERAVFCGLDEHTHTDECFVQQEAPLASRLICSVETLDIHSHTESCYGTDGSLLCGLADYVAHTHDASCLDADGALVCPLPEISPHVHTGECFHLVQSEHTCDDTCFTLIQGELICQEETEGHTHDSECFITTEALTCQKDETEGHAHGAECFIASEVLTCRKDETEGHAHGAECFIASEVLTCQKDETEGHIHGDTCFIFAGQLTCPMEESEDHVHGDDCYAEADLLVCQAEESEAHAHSEGCYTTTDLLVCQEEETEAHTHDEECYTLTDLLICQTEETEAHTHSDDCFGTVLVCETEEVEGHTHTDGCYTWEQIPACPEEPPVEQLVCQIPSVPEHIHSEECFVTEAVQPLTCVLEENEEHTHTEMCYGTWETVCGYEVHAHLLSCYSDPAADVESAAAWEQSFAGASLTGMWCDDVRAIAKTQLGYQESTKNYTVLEDGETIKGYTRYGAWYGSPYADWCAMFASFCLDYAGVEEMPLDANCHDWIERLSAEEYRLYHEAGSYEPRPGDLVFFDWEGDGLSDHVGILSDVIAADEESPARIRTIEGNSSNQVCYQTYEAADGRIMGYGALPVQLTAAQQAQVDAVIAAIDAMPSADEIDAKMLEFEDAEDYEGLEQWYTQVCQQVAEAYQIYSELTDEQKAQVTNAEKLLELEYIWSATILLDKIYSDAPTTVGSTGTDPVVSTNDFVKLNIYDYYGTASASTAGKTNINALWNSNKKYPGFQWNGGAYMTSSSFSRSRVDNIDFGNSMITDFTYGSVGSSIANGYSSNRQMIGNHGGTINQVIGYTIQPIGYSSGTSYDALQHTLKNGYPALSDGTSLSYLFSESTYASKENTSNIDGLFRQNQTTGEYWFDSRENHAQYSNNRFTLYNQIITPNFILYPFGNFLPFNDITNGDQTTQVSAIDYVVQSGSTGTPGYMQTIINRLLEGSENSTENQLISMLANYRNSLSNNTSDADNRYNWTVEDALIDYFSNSSEFKNDYNYNTLFYSDDAQALLDKLYNIDFDIPKNFMFGMDMEMNFMQPKDGMTGNDTNQDGKPDYPMEFYFAGDDDVWVYIDGILFLDLSGIHRHVGGDIDFVNGKVNYYMMDSYIDGAVSSSPYKTMTFAEILTDIGGVAESDLGNYLKKDANGSYTTFKDYTTHSFKFYYMERGTGSSVCRINFNFPLLRQNTISVSKEVTSDTPVMGNPDYPFQVLKANANGTKTNELFIKAGTAYTIYDQNDMVIGSGTTDANGVFTLKAGQRAEFTGIKENAGKYYVRELLDGTVLEQYGQITVSGESTTTQNNVTVGSDTFTGMDSPVKDMSDGATAFRFTNDVDQDKLGSLSVSKKVTEYSPARVSRIFDIRVMIDGVPLPVGTKYAVGEETRTVEREGIISIAADETAKIPQILAGSSFAVKETSNSAEGYVVTYTEGGQTVAPGENGVTGVIKAGAHVDIVVRNSEKGTSVTIPGSKSLYKPDGAEHTYTMRLTEVTDSTGKTVLEGGLADYTVPVSVTDSPGQFSFTINYAQVDLETLPLRLYYSITEDDPTDGISLPNDTVYVAEVTITETENGDLSAAVTNLWKGTMGTDGPGELTQCEGISADFTNTLTGSLTLSKTVSGTTTDRAFGFTITLTPGDSGLDALAGEVTFPVILNHADGTQQETRVRFTDGVTTLSMQHGESLTILEIPYGTAWTITETDGDGFKVTTQVISGDTTVSGTGIDTGGSILVGGTAVAYTNEVTYRLPETGGAGTTLYTMTGLALMLGTACLLYIPRTRRKGGNDS